MLPTIDWPGTPGACTTLPSIMDVAPMPGAPTCAPVICETAMPPGPFGPWNCMDWPGTPPGICCCPFGPIHDTDASPTAPAPAWPIID